MYIKEVNIAGIGCIENLNIQFPDTAAGWHVIIGDNGTGKSTILRAIAAVLVGPEQVSALNIVWTNLLKQEAREGSIALALSTNADYDKYDTENLVLPQLIENDYLFHFDNKKSLRLNAIINQGNIPPKNYNWGEHDGWFSCGFGSFRRFSGGNESKSKVYKSSPKAGAHLSLFGEDVALTEALDWLRDLDNKSVRKRSEEVGKRLKDINLEALHVYKETKNRNSEEFEKTPDSLKEELFKNIVIEVLSSTDFDNSFPEGRILKAIKIFINKTKLLPNNAQFQGFDIDGYPKFVDGNGSHVNIGQMSDGYRSILSLTFELIRQLIRTYGDEEVCKNMSEEGDCTVTLPGVVLIDEIDAHLHPTWQVKIGSWFRQYFPNLQFIVTTHNPLICRASEEGTIWRLENDEGVKIKEILGEEKEKLLYGNILDAYGTELFGASPVRSDKSNEKLERLGELNMLYALEKITEAEELERVNLLKILSTDDPTGF